MSIEISKEARKEAVSSIERYFREHMEEPVSGLAADGLLAFFIEEIGPVIYNKAVSDVQQVLQTRVMEIDFEVHEDAFTFWNKRKK